MAYIKSLEFKLGMDLVYRIQASDFSDFHASMKGEIHPI